MRGRSVGAAVGAILAAALMFAQTASAVTVGSDCSGTTSEGGGPIVSLKNPPGYPLPSAIPSAGVVTSWTFTIHKAIPNGVFQEQLKVFAPAGPGAYTVVGESAVVPIVTGVNTFPVRLTVAGGDLLGSLTFGVGGGKVESGYIFCATGDPGDEIAVLPGAPVVGETVTATKTITEVQNPINVSVEPDADGDGFGDETQDACPANPLLQSCPTIAPLPPPLSPLPTPHPLAIASLHKGSLTVKVTSDIAATVAVASRVALGGGAAATPSGGKKTVAAGGTASFTLKFPRALKTKLAGLPVKRKLTLLVTITATSPAGPVGTTHLSQKLPGRG
jgi:hypothetical protein